MRKYIYNFLIIFLFVLVGCKPEIKFEKIIDFKVISYYENNILGDKGCKIEYRRIWETMNKTFHHVRD